MREIQVSKRQAATAGSCNACSHDERHIVVYEISAGHSIRVAIRLCDRHLRELITQWKRCREEPCASR